MPTRRDLLFVAAVIGAVAALGITVLLVLTAGVAEEGGLPSLRERPNPAIPGRIAYLRSDGCIIVADASGAAARESTCVPPFAVVALAWVDEETLALAAFLDGAPAATPSPVPPGATPVPFPPATGPQWFLLRLGEGSLRPTGILAEGALRPAAEGARGPDGRIAWVDPAASTLYVSSGAGRQAIEIPGKAGLSVSTWSPDGRWVVLLRYRSGSEFEVILVDTETGEAAWVARDASAAVPAWWIDGVGSWPRYAELEALGR
ncbi:MAG: hypothetical protein RMK15_03895 [Chloroflexota bacterium]|nr:hypothetical protein [Dehalococcoidia bacterium]MDW8046406.1 hypothetical protein [Chloroflexota bacterium]